MNPKFFSFFILCVLVFALAYPVSADDVSITFADLNIIHGVKILVYNETGQFVGEYNSTDTTTFPATNHSYVFILKPTDQSLFTSPAGTIQVLSAYLPLTINYLIAGVFIIGIAYAVSRLWK